ncbi:hypothetical protein PIB30_063316, partial [Stylosanthes scabra]|nr:hypothetical protein [Stylosanthes scabra]
FSSSSSDESKAPNRVFIGAQTRHRAPLAPTVFISVHHLHPQSQFSQQPLDSLLNQRLRSFRFSVISQPLDLIKINGSQAFIKLRRIRAFFRPGFRPGSETQINASRSSASPTRFSDPQTDPFSPDPATCHGIVFPRVTIRLCHVSCYC